MDLEEKEQLTHDLTNSFVIINSISRSAYNFIGKFSQNETAITTSQVDLFKKAMLSLQEEVTKIEKFFQDTLSKL